jgi:SAM-dependent methyltransferase
MSEAAKIRNAVFPLLQGRTVLDLGCGQEKIVPWAVGVDSGTSWKEIPKAVDLVSAIDGASGLLAHSLLCVGKPVLYDVVFSSHSLEHVFSPIMRVLLDWLSLVRISGRLILYVPDEMKYRFSPANPRVHNPEHLHFLTAEVMRLCLDDLSVRGLIEIERFEERNASGGHDDEYSVLIVARRLL